MSEPQDDRWQPVPVPLGDGRHDVGDAVRAAIAQRLIEDFGRVPDLTPHQVHHLALFGAASVRALLHELGTLRDLAAAPVPCAASPADPWQPIETAPKDGTKILVYTVHGEIELTFWFTVETDRYDDVGDGLYRKREETVAEGWNGNCPTHWMPLPTPPRATGEGARDEQTQTVQSETPSCGKVDARAQSSHRLVGDASCAVAEPSGHNAADPTVAPVAVSLDPHRLRLVADLLDPLLAQVDDCALWKVLNEADEHKASWSVDAWRQWFVQLVDAASELSCRLEDPDFVARLRGEATVRPEVIDHGFGAHPVGMKCSICDSATVRVEE